MREVPSHLLQRVVVARPIRDADGQLHRDQHRRAALQSADAVLVQTNR